ncbi:MAG: DUF421 domain-containing protein [Chthoniobacterales bacterium]
MQQFYDSFSAALGLGVNPAQLTFWQLCLRGLVVLFVTLAIMRMGQKRSLARKTPFDVVLLFILASVLARAVNGSAAFFPTLGASVVLMVVHRLLGFGACRWHWLGWLLKGESDILVLDGQRQKHAMNRNHISDRDLEEDLRLAARTEELAKIKIARLERSGDISFIRKEDA